MTAADPMWPRLRWSVVKGHLTLRYHEFPAERYPRPLETITVTPARLVVWRRLFEGAL